MFSNWKILIDSTLFGNCVGLFSTIIGICGIVLTLMTFQSAKKIEKKVHEEKISAIDKSKFNEAKHRNIAKLEQKRKQVKNQNIVSQHICLECRTIINDQYKYTNILSEKDLIGLKKDKEGLDKLINSLKYKDDSQAAILFDDIIADVIRIIDKGEYEI